MKSGPCFVCAEETTHFTHPHDGGKRVFCCGEDCYKHEKFQDHIQLHNLAAPKKQGTLQPKLDKKFYFGSIHDWFHIEVTEDTVKETQMRRPKFAEDIEKMKFQEMKTNRLSRVWLICHVLNKLIRRIEIESPDAPESVYPLTTKQSPKRVCIVKRSQDQSHRLSIVFAYKPAYIAAFEFITKLSNKMGWPDFSLESYFTCTCFRDRFDWTSLNTPLNMMTTVFAVQFESALNNVIKIHKDKQMPGTLDRVTYQSNDTSSTPQWRKGKKIEPVSVLYEEPLTVVQNNLWDMFILAEQDNDISGIAWSKTHRKQRATVKFFRENPSIPWDQNYALSISSIEESQPWRLKTKLEVAKESIFRQLLEPWNMVKSPYAEKYRRLLKFATWDFIFESIVLLFPSTEKSRAMQFSLGGGMYPRNRVALHSERNAKNANGLFIQFQPFESGYNNFVALLKNMNAMEVDAYLRNSRIDRAPELFPQGSAQRKQVEEMLSDALNWLSKSQDPKFKSKFQTTGDLDKDKTILGTAMNNLLNIRLFFPRGEKDPRIVVKETKLPTGNYARIIIASATNVQLFPKLPMSQKGKNKLPPVVPPVVPVIPFVPGPVMVTPPEVIEIPDSPPQVVTIPEPKPKKLKPRIPLEEPEQRIRVLENITDYRSMDGIGYRKELATDLERMRAKDFIRKYTDLPLSVTYFLLDCLFEVAVLFQERDSAPAYRVFPVNAVSFPVVSPAKVASPLHVAIRYIGSEIEHRRKCWSAFKVLRGKATSILLDKLNQDGKELREKYWESRFELTDQSMSWGTFAPDDEKINQLMMMILDSLGNNAYKPKMDSYSEFYVFNPMNRQWKLSQNIDYPIYIGSRLVEGDKRKASELEGVPLQPATRVKTGADSVIESYVSRAKVIADAFSTDLDRQDPVEFMKVSRNPFELLCFLFDHVIKNIGVLVSEDNREFYKVIPLNPGHTVWDDNVKIVEPMKLFVEFAGSEIQIRRKVWKILQISYKTLPLLNGVDDPADLWNYWLYRFNIQEHDLRWEPLSSREKSRDLFKLVIDAIRGYSARNPGQSVCRYFKVKRNKWLEAKSGVTYPKYIGGKQLPIGLPKIAIPIGMKECQTYDINKIFDAVETGELKKLVSNKSLVADILFWKHNDPFVALFLLIQLSIEKQIKPDIEVRFKVDLRMVPHFMGIDDSVWTYFIPMLAYLFEISKEKISDNVMIQLVMLQQSLRRGFFKRIFAHYLPDRFPLIVGLDGETFHAEYQGEKGESESLSMEEFAERLDSFTNTRVDLIPVHICGDKSIQNIDLATVKLYMSYGVLQAMYESLKPAKLVGIKAPEPTKPSKLLSRIFPMKEAVNWASLADSGNRCELTRTWGGAQTETQFQVITEYPGFIRQLKFPVVSGFSRAELGAFVLSVTTVQKTFNKLAAWFKKETNEDPTVQILQQLITYIGRYINCAAPVSNLVLLYNEEAECWAIVHPKSSLMSLW